MTAVVFQSYLLAIKPESLNLLVGGLILILGDRSFSSLERLMIVFIAFPVVFSCGFG